MKFRSRVKKLQEVLGTDKYKASAYELLENGNYLNFDGEEITREQLSKVDGLKLIIEWVEPDQKV